MGSRLLAPGLSIALLLAACVPKPRVEPTGYLGDYTGFEREPGGGNALIYRKPELDLARYHRVIVDPVVVSMSADSAGKAIDPADLMTLSNYLQTALVVALRDTYPVIEEPAEYALRLRVAITDVVATRPALNTIGTLFVPARAASAAKRVITGTDLFVGEVAIEAEAVDSLTGERLMARVDRKAGDKFTLKEGATSWGHVEKAFRDWAISFRRNLDAAHGR